MITNQMVEGLALRVRGVAEAIASSGPFADIDDARSVAIEARQWAVRTEELLRLRDSGAALERTCESLAFIAELCEFGRLAALSRIRQQLVRYGYRVNRTVLLAAEAAGTDRLDPDEVPAIAGSLV